MHCEHYRIAYNVKPNSCLSDLPTQAEARIGQFMVSSNRPYNAQMVTDFLACEGFKKTQVQKALDSLAESNRITCKVSRLWTAVLLAISRMPRSRSPHLARESAGACFTAIFARVGSTDRQI